MAIAGLNTPAMAEIDHFAIAAAPARLFDDAIAGRIDRLAGSAGHIDTRVHHNAAVERIVADRSEEHTSELQSLMRISYAVFCLKKTKHKNDKRRSQQIIQHM